MFNYSVITKTNIYLDNVFFLLFFYKFETRKEGKNKNERQIHFYVAGINRLFIFTRVLFFLIDFFPDLSPFSPEIKISVHVVRSRLQK